MNSRDSAKAQAEWFMILWSQLVGGGRRTVKTVFAFETGPEVALKKMQDFNRQKLLNTSEYLVINLKDSLESAGLSLVVKDGEKTVSSDLGEPEVPVTTEN
jgi:hypothetical protein